MFYPPLKDFIKLSKSANVIPVYKEVSADLDTPVSSFLKLSKDRYSFLLESVEGQEKIARYSFLGTRPELVFSCKGRAIEIFEQNKNKKRSFITKTDPLTELSRLMRDFKPVHIKGLPRFWGGFVGFISYDCVRFIEDIPDKNPDDLGLADMVFILTDTLLAFDHVNHTIKIISNCIIPSGRKVSLEEKRRIYRKAAAKINALEQELSRPLKSGPVRQAHAPAKPAITSNFAKSGFCGIVNKAKNYIKSGDIIQVVLSQRFQAQVRREPFDIYRRLRSLNPSPYMFFLQLADATLIGASPELLVRCEHGKVQTHPIAGTRPRGATEEQDALLQRQLLADQKERAEHLMLVDLGRNDLGRVCVPGSVRVDRFMDVERYSHVMHLVSNVTGTLDKRFDCFDVLRATFPAGTVSGAPKVRAMQIIDELEKTRRGPYAGAVGYISFSKDLDTCITIRTICIKNKKRAYVQAGAGIVADSRPEKEYQETINKAKALTEALE